MTAHTLVRVQHQRRMAVLKCNKNENLVMTKILTDVRSETKKARIHCYTSGCACYVKENEDFVMTEILIDVCNLIFLSLHNLATTYVFETSENFLGNQGSSVFYFAIITSTK